MNIEDHELLVWEHPKDYGGFSPDGDYLIYSRTRDSNLLENSNYECIFEDLKNIAKPLQDPEHEDYVYDFRARHFTIGWVEYILVSKDAPFQVVNRAKEILCALAEYPVFNETKYSEMEYLAIAKYWGDASLQDRMNICKEQKESIFAARHDCLSDLPDSVYEYLTVIVNE